MTRPNEHGGGQAGPPIAGDPASFPTDAELARTLAARRRATLCTLTAEGYPYGSAVSYVDDAAGVPVVLISEMAEHTVNARGDSRASILVSDETADAADPLADVAAGTIAHMNDDHRNANLAYVRVLAGLTTATDATMAGIDRYGVTLQASTPEGPRLARVPFPEPLSSADQARPAVIALVRSTENN